MLIFSFKLFASILILCIAFICGLFPILIKVSARTKKCLLYGESFAAGVFLGAGFIHLLPDAQFSLHSVYHYHYPFVFAICAASIFLLRFIEETSEQLFKENSSLRQNWLAYLLTILLSIHSILAGVALGVETTIASFLVVLLAIMAHKGSAAFALGVTMRRSEMHTKKMVKLLITFAVMTPVGILFGTFLTQLLQANSSHVATAVFNAIAAGTFIYIAAFHTRHCHCEEEDVCEHAIFPIVVRSTYFLLGLVVMGVVAIWV